MWVHQTRGYQLYLRWLQRLRSEWWSAPHDNRDTDKPDQQWTTGEGYQQWTTGKPDSQWVCQSNAHKWDKQRTMWETDSGTTWLQGEGVWFSSNSGSTRLQQDLFWYNYTLVSLKDINLAIFESSYTLIINFSETCFCWWCDTTECVYSKQ